MQLQLSQGQQDAIDAMKALMADPTRNTLVISGAAGTGKTYCLQELIKIHPAYQSALNRLNHKHKQQALKITATTNKAVEALAQVGIDACTIHSLLKLTIEKDQRGKDKLVQRDPDFKIRDCIIVIDESSYLSEQMMDYLETQTVNCKYILVGDAQQLTPVGLNYAPAFIADFDTVELTEILRQSNGNPIQKLSEDLRKYVAGAAFPAIPIDGINIVYMDKKNMFQEMIYHFSQPKVSYYDAKFIGWRNATVKGIAHDLSTVIKKSPYFKARDYAVCNSYFQSDKVVFKTDSLVGITKAGSVGYRYGIPGQEVEVNGRIALFVPHDLEMTLKVKDQFWKTDKKAYYDIEKTFIDLRTVYSCTIHKAQGSTFDTVYLDLDDLMANRNPDELARLIYVAISRARSKLVLTGTLP